MRTLVVTMIGDALEDRLLALPFDVYGPNGEPVGKGVVSPMRAWSMTLPEAATAMPRIHVVAVRPDGERLQASTPLTEGENRVALDVGDRSPREWLRWVTPFRSLDHLREPAGEERPRPPSRRIGNVWMTVWALRDGRWTATDLRPREQLRTAGARQVVLDIPACPHLLQVGGDDVAWRLVSLPPSSQTRVALTRRATEDGDSVDVTVSRTKPFNELVMSYLTSGASEEADALAEVWHAADFALYMKAQDPVSATAGAYVLLKMNRLGDRQGWVDNLVEWFDYLADGPIVAAALELQSCEGDPQRARQCIEMAMQRGLPMFSMGISVLVETMAAVHRGKKESKRFQMWYQAARAYLQARSSRGAYFSFYGRSPAEPSWTRIYGSADTPTATSNEPRLGTGQGVERVSNFGSIAPSLERALAKSNSSKSTDDLLRLGLSRQYSLPAEAGLDLFRNLGANALGIERVSLPGPDNDWNLQRQRNSFMVFDGDE